MKKNIILLLVDGIGEEDIKFIKKNLRYFSGFKKFLSKNSIEYFNTYATATPTEPVMPTLFTGELPLNKKTYEFGIKNFRKDYLLDLKKNEFELKILSSTGVISDMMGYSNDLVNIDFYQSVQHSWKYFKTYCMHYLRLNNKKKLFLFKRKFFQFLSFYEYLINNDKSWYSKVINNLNKKKKIRIKSKIEIIKQKFNKITYSNVDTEIKEVLKKDFFDYFDESSVKHKFLNILSKIFKDKFLSWKYAKLN